MTICTKAVVGNAKVKDTNNIIWENAGIDALAIAQKLWTETHPLRIPPTAAGQAVVLSTPSATIEPGRRVNVDRN
jgi:hypothetical protein